MVPCKSGRFVCCEQLWQACVRACMIYITEAIALAQHYLDIVCIHAFDIEYHFQRPRDVSTLLIADQKDRSYGLL